jgi:hypothetical protein
MTAWNESLERFGTFADRCVFLLVFAVLIAAIDLALNGRRATRWREYSLLLLAAVVGAVCGMVVDSITSVVSPEYFVEGKGIVPGDGFRWRAVALGAQAGAGCGALLGGVLMIAAGRDFSLHRSARQRVASACLEIALWALGGGIVALPDATISRIWLSWIGGSAALGDDELLRKSAVWLCHLGVYAGALVGVVVAIRRLRRWRATRFASASTRMAGEAGIEPATY